MKYIVYFVSLFLSASAVASQKLCKGEGMEMIINISEDKLTVVEVQGESRTEVVYNVFTTGVRRNRTNSLVYSGLGPKEQWYTVNVDQNLTFAKTVGLIRFTDSRPGGVHVFTLTCADDPAASSSPSTCDKTLQAASASK